MLGGQSIVPGLSLVSQKSDVILLSSRNSSDGRTNQEKQMEILEYLKTLPRDQMVFNVL